MNIQQQFMQDAQSMANNLMVQQMCLQQGIDYNALMQVAQQSQMKQIMQAEALRQQSEMIKRHYNGGEKGMFGKIKEAIVGEPSSVNPMVMQQMMNPAMNPMMGGMVNPMMAQPIAQPMGMIPPMGMAPQQIQPIIQEVIELPKAENNEVAALKQEMSQMKEVMAQFMAMQVQNMQSPKKETEPKKEQQTIIPGMVQK